MIKISIEGTTGCTRIQGRIDQVLTEYVYLTRALNKKLADRLGEAEAKEIMEETFADAYKSEAEIVKDIKEEAKKNQVSEDDLVESFRAYLKELRESENV